MYSDDPVGEGGTWVRFLLLHEHIVTSIQAAGAIILL